MQGILALGTVGPVTLGLDITQHSCDERFQQASAATLLADKSGQGLARLLPTPSFNNGVDCSPLDWRLGPPVGKLYVVGIRKLFGA